MNHNKYIRWSWKSKKLHGTNINEVTSIKCDEIFNVIYRMDAKTKKKYPLSRKSIMTLGFQTWKMHQWKIRNENACLQK